MQTSSLLILNFEEVRRRSVKTWRSIPTGVLAFRVDAGAMSLLEQVRHVLEGEYLYAEMLRTGGDLASETTPWAMRPLVSVDDELQYAEPHRRAFFELLASYSARDLAERRVTRASRGYSRTFGDFLLRMAYHEAVHLGQLLRDLRAAGVDRPPIWD